MKNILSRYPKKRKELTGIYKEIYTEYYINNRNGNSQAASLSQKVEAWLHKKVAADVPAIHSKSTLEIGGGTLNQLKFETSDVYDVVEPFKELYINSPDYNKVRKFYNDISEVDINNRYDRITSIATFEHIENLPEVVAKTCLLLNDKGTLRVSIPNEGNFIWAIGWKLTTGLEFKLKRGLDYGVIMEHEHMSNANEIEAVLKYFYRNVKVSYFGLGKHFALYRFYECSNPDMDKAKEYINRPRL